MSSEGKLKLLKIFIYLIVVIISVVLVSAKAPDGNYTGEDLLASNGVVGADLWTSNERGVFLWDIVCTNATRGWHYYNGVSYTMGLGVGYNGIKKWIGLHP